MALITCKDVCLGYDGQAVLQDVNFEVCRGDLLCIVGENGSGKSTLIKGLLGLKAPLSGSITLGDGLKHTEIGYLPQQTELQRDFPASVMEVVFSGRLNGMHGRPFYSKADRAAALENLERMGVEDLKNQSYQALSGGQQQRVLLARALCAANDLLILDEPVTGLDPASMQDLYKTLRYLNAREGMAIIMVTHDMENALREAKHILSFDRRGCFYGTVGEFLSSPAGKRFGGEKR